MTNKSIEEWRNEEPFVSIEGILWELEGGATSVHGALELIHEHVTSYAKQEREGGMKTCIECGGIADAPPEQQSESYPICATCLSTGWTTDPLEIQTDISLDPELRDILKDDHA